MFGCPHTVVSGINLAGRWVPWGNISESWKSRNRASERVSALPVRVTRVPDQGSWAVSRQPTRCGNEAQALPYRTDGVLDSNQSRAWRARLLVPPDGWCVLEPYHGFEFRIQRVPSQEIGRVGGSYCKYPGLR
jgi:hypothetical protein